MAAPASLLALREMASTLLVAWETERPAAVGGDTAGYLRRLVEQVDRVTARAEKDSAAAHQDGQPRLGDVAGRLGVDVSTLRRHRRRIARSEL